MKELGDFECEIQGKVEQNKRNIFGENLKHKWHFHSRGEWFRRGLRNKIIKRRWAEGKGKDRIGGEEDFSQHKGSLKKEEKDPKQKWRNQGWIFQRKHGRDLGKENKKWTRTNREDPDTGRMSSNWNRKLQSFLTICSSVFRPKGKPTYGWIKGEFLQGLERFPRLRTEIKLRDLIKSIKS